MTYGGSRRPDLAARLRRGQRVLKSRLERPETVLALLRAAHDSLDPESIGKLVVNRAEEWFKAPACGVFAADLDGQVVGLASKGMGAALAPAAIGVARWVIGHGRELASADLAEGSASDGRRGRRARVAAAVPRANRGGARGDGTAGGHASAAHSRRPSAQLLGIDARGAGAGARQRAAVEAVGSAYRSPTISRSSTTLAT